MVLKRSPFPKPGELVVVRVTHIDRNYIEVILEDYKGRENEENAHGMVHISELSNRWVKNINSIISEGQRLVMVVLRVNEQRGYVDLSLRRVNKVQRQTTMNEWRYATKLEGLLKFFAETHNISLEDLYDMILWPLIDVYGDIRTAFEEIKEEGMDILKNVEGNTLSDELNEALYQLIKENITISKVSIIAEYEIRSFEGNGIELIKQAFKEAENLEREKGTELLFRYIGAPTYRCEIIAPDYQIAEGLLQNITNKMKEVLGDHSTIEVHRDNLSSEQ